MHSQPSSTLHNPPYSRHNSSTIGHPPTTRSLLHSQPLQCPSPMPCPSVRSRWTRRGRERSTAPVQLRCSGAEASTTKYPVLDGWPVAILPAELLNAGGLGWGPGVSTEAPKPGGWGAPTHAMSHQQHVFYLLSPTALPPPPPPPGRRHTPCEPLKSSGHSMCSFVSRGRQQFVRG